MMNGLSLAAVGLLVAGTGFARETNPLDFPAYEQSVDATFASAADATAATCAIAPLPDDAKISFSCRWDDTSSAHLEKARMMKRAGVKGTFYFVGGSDNAFFREGPPKLCPLGHAIGNHTLHHGFLLQMNLNKAFREFAMNRIQLETNLQHTVNSFVAPFGWRQNPIDPAHGARLAECLVASGHFLSRDNPQKWSPFGEETWMPAWRFSSDDRNPQRDLFVRGFKSMTAGATAHPLSPCVVLGTHSWCGEKGLKDQETWINEFCKRPDWCTLNDWEYGAYRYQALHGGVEKVGTSGATARFRVRRFASALVGDAIPLSLRFSAAPKAVSADGAALASAPRGTWTLPAAKGRGDLTCVACADARGVAAELPGLLLTLVPDEAKGTLSVRFENAGGAALEDVYVAGAVPPAWTVRRVTATAKKLAAGAAFEKTFALGKKPRADFAFGTAFYPVSVDFVREGKPMRLWAWTETARVETPANLPGRSVRVWGPAEATPLAGADLAVASRTGAVLPDAAGWKKPAVDADAVWTLVASGTRKAPELQKLLEAGNHARLFAYDFNVPKAGFAKLRTNVGAGGPNRRLYVNGESVPFKGDGQRLQVKAGTNRLVLRADASAHGRYAEPVYIAVVAVDGSDFGIIY